MPAVFVLAMPTLTSSPVAEKLLGPVHWYNPFSMGLTASSSGSPKQGFSCWYDVWYFSAP